MRRPDKWSSASARETYDECPHCKQEIYEKSTYSPDGGITFVHRNCGGALLFPEEPLENIAAWLRPSVEKIRALRAGGAPLL